MTPLKKLVEQFMWSMVGDVAKFVLSQKQVMKLMEEEKEALHEAYMEGYFMAMNSRMPDFEKFYEQKYESDTSI